MDSGAAPTPPHQAAIGAQEAQLAGLQLTGPVDLPLAVQYQLSFGQQLAQCAHDEKQVALGGFSLAYQQFLAFLMLLNKDWLPLVTWLYLLLK